VAKVRNFSIFGDDENDIEKSARLSLRCKRGPGLLFIMAFFLLFFP
jgi:hypothetical protein